MEITDIAMTISICKTSYGEILGSELLKTAYTKSFLDKADNNWKALK